MNTPSSVARHTQGQRQPAAVGIPRPADAFRRRLATRSSAARLGFALWSGAFLGPLLAASPPSTPPAPASTDLAARARFLAVERFARLPGDQRASHFPEFYRTLAPYFVNGVIEAVLSSYPADILDRRTYGHPGGDAKARWAAQLAEAAARLTPEEVADKLGSRLWLDVAGRARTIQMLQEQPAPLASLIAGDLASGDLAAVQRACAVIGDLRLRQFTGQVLDLYLADTALAPPARTALVWLADPATVRPLLERIEKDPRQIIRHAGLFQGPLAGAPAEPLLLKLLEAAEPDIRCQAASALSECRDASLAAPAARLAKAADPRLQSAALTLALRLPDDAFATIHDDLAPLLSSPEDPLCLEAVTCFARRKDPLAGPPILRFLQRERMDAGQAVTVMQALNALAGSAFGYDLHNWGPKPNARSIARFQAWLRRAGGR